MNRRVISRLVLFAVFAAAGIARADEIRLKDGTKIIGTIVGYENDSFKIETAYGFALVRKDKVAEIIPAAPAKESEPKAEIKAEPKAEPKTKPATSVSATPADVPPVTAKESSPTATDPPNATAATKDDSLTVKTTSKTTAKTPVKATIAPASAVAPASTLAPVPAVAAVAPSPVAAPSAPVIHDEIRGNLYVNLTFGFQMYKPPSWELIPAASNALPNAVAALGTNDETTLLVIGREGQERANGSSPESLDTYAASTEKALSEIYDNYRLISGRRTMVGQLPAVERRFRGTADGHDWSVLLLTFAHGNDFFTMLGMTWADSDLIQVEENVIAKAVNSLTFTTQ